MLRVGLLRIGRLALRGLGLLLVFYRIGDEPLSLQDAAHRACDALRGLVRHFLPQATQKAYKKPEFWEGGNFGWLIQRSR
jgi:hypothetical protein